MSYIERDKNGNRVYRKPNCQCSVCGTEIYRRPKELAIGKVYCSKECQAKAQTKNIFTCQNCGKEFHRKHHKKNHLPKYCSTSCSNQGRTGTYEYGTYKHPRNKAHKCRVLKLKLAKQRGACCERCGEDNFYVLEVHHKVEVSKGGTDDFDNLELLCGNCHNEHHRGWGDMDDYIKEYELEKWCKANL